MISRHGGVGLSRASLWQCQSRNQPPIEAIRSPAGSFDPMPVGTSAAIKAAAHAESDSFGYPKSCYWRPLEIQVLRRWQIREGAIWAPPAKAESIQPRHRPAKGCATAFR